jgi:hypothetical protein
VTKLLRTVLVVTAFSVLAVTAPGMDEHTAKSIPVNIRVEAEDANALWVPSSRGPTQAELTTLQSLSVAELRKQKGVEIVPAEYSHDYIFIGVAVGKVPDGRGGYLYVASSAYTTVTVVQGKIQTEDFVLHNVLAGSDLRSLSKAIGFQFASVRLRAALGSWK